MGDVPSEGLALRIAPQPDITADPTAGWVQLRPDKGSLQGWEKTLQTVEDTPIDPNMVDRQGEVVGWSCSPQFAHVLSKDLADLFAEPMLRCVGAHPGGKGQRVYRATAVVDGAAGEDSLTVPANGDLPGKTVIVNRGYGQPANNGKFVTAADSAANAIKVPTGTFAAEAAPPENATTGVWGFEGAADDIEINAAGHLISTVEDFTLRGIPVGTLVGFDDGDAAHEFGTLGVFYAWVKSVSAHLVELEHHAFAPGVVLGADDGAGKTIRVHVFSLYRNYPILTQGNTPGYRKSRAFGEIEWPGEGDDGSTRWTRFKALAVNKVDIAGPLKQKITATVQMVALDVTDELDAASREAAGGVGRGDRASTAFQPLATSMSNTATDLRFCRLIDPTGANIIPKINNWTLTLNNNTKPRDVQGTAGSDEHTFGTFQPSVKMQVYLTSPKQINAAKNNTKLTWDVCVENGDYTVAFRVPRTALRNPKRTIPANEQVTLDFDAPGFGHETTNVAIVMCIGE
jgi:hypothetical protein